MTEGSRDVNVHSKILSLDGLLCIHRYPFPEQLLSCVEKDLVHPALAKRCYLGEPQNTPPQLDGHFVVVLQHSCLLPHCQISSIDIYKTRSSRLPSQQGFLGMHRWEGSLMAEQGNRVVLCQSHS